VAKKGVIELQDKLLDKIKSGRRLTEIEFSLCSQELQSIYCKEKIAKGQIEGVVVQFCDIDTIHKYIIDSISRCDTIPKDIFEKATDDKLLERYLLMKVISNQRFFDYEIGKLDTTVLAEHIKTIIDSEKVYDLWLKFENFKLLDEVYKIKYIFNKGLCNVEDEITKWFDIWKKAKARDLKILQILAD